MSKLPKPNLTANQLQRIMRDRDLGFSISGPEEGDTIDQSVWVVDGDGDELIHVRGDGLSLARRKEIGRKLAHWLNEGECEIVRGQRPIP